MGTRRQLVSRPAAKLAAAWLLFAVPMVLGLFEAKAADGGTLRLGIPSIVLRSNLYFRAQNSTPECACNFQTATNLRAPINWTTRVEGLANQTNFPFLQTWTTPAFYRLRYKPYIAAPPLLYAAQSTRQYFTNIQILSFQGAAGELSLSAFFGPLYLGVTDGLTFLSGANGQPSFTVSGSYSNLSAALSTLSYLGHAGVGATDTVNIVLANIGPSARCFDSNAVRIALHTPPYASGNEYSAVGQLNEPAPGLLGCCAYSPHGDPMSLVPQNTTTGYGQLELRADGSVSYHPLAPPSTTIVEQFNYQVYDTFGGGMHSTSTPARLTISIDP